MFEAMPVAIAELRFYEVSWGVGGLATSTKSVVEGEHENVIDTYRGEE